MERVIHRPVLYGTIGKVDSWGFGCAGRAWDYPTLSLRGILTTTTRGGDRYPLIEETYPVFYDRLDYIPDLEWGRWTPTYNLPSGRTLIAVLIDGERCFVEEVSA